MNGKYSIKKFWYNGEFYGLLASVIAIIIELLAPFMPRNLQIQMIALVIIILSFTWLLTYVLNTKWISKTVKVRKIGRSLYLNQISESNLLCCKNAFKKNIVNALDWSIDQLLNYKCDSIMLVSHDYVISKINTLNTDIYLQKLYSDNLSYARHNLVKKCLKCENCMGRKSCNVYNEKDDIVDFYAIKITRKEK